MEEYQTFKISIDMEPVTIEYIRMVYDPKNKTGVYLHLLARMCHQTGKLSKEAAKILDPMWKKVVKKHEN